MTRMPWLCRGDVILRDISVCACLLLASFGWAQERPAPSATIVVTAGSVREQLKQLDTATSLDDKTKAEIRDLLEQTLRNSEAIEKWNVEADGFRRAAETAAADARKVRQDLENQRSTNPASLPEDLSIAELSERLASCDGRLSELRAEATTAKEEPNRRNTRRRKISQLLADLPKKASAIETQLQATPPPGDEPVELISARQNYLATQLHAMQGQIRALDAERAAYDATVDILPVRRRLAVLRLMRAELEVEQLRGAIAQRNREDVDKQLRDARHALSDTEDKSRPAAEESVRLAEQRLEVRRRLDSASSRHTAVQHQLEHIRVQAKRTQDQILSTGLTSAIGQLLRRHRIELLPDEKNLHNEMARRQAEIQSLQQSMFELENRQRQLESQNDKEQGSQSVGPRAGEPSRTNLRLQNLDLLITDTRTYFYKLIDLDSTQRELLDESRQYARFIDEHALWIRGSGLFRPTDPRHARDAMLWLISAEGWRSVHRTLADDTRARPALTIAAVAVFILLLHYRRLANRQVIELGDRAIRATAQQFTPTLLAFALTLLSALPWPALMAYLGWRLGVHTGRRDFSYALAVALSRTAVPCFLLVLARQTCRAKGLAGAHFGWTNTDLAPLRRWLRLMMVFTLPLAFLIALFDAAENPLWRYSLGRAALVLLGLIVAVFAHRLLRPERGIIYHVSIAAREGWLHHGRYVVYLLAVATPLLLAGLAIAGYYLAAFRLAERATLSTLLLFGLLLLGSLLFRWVLVTRRWLAMKQARERRDAQRLAAASQRLHGRSAESEATPSVATISHPAELSESVSAQADETPPVLSEPAVDLAAITAQTRRFLWTAVAAAAAIGLWAIWSDVLPALGVLDQVELWRTSVQTTETVETITGSVITREIPRIEAVTLADCILVGVVMAMTLAAARNLPGLMEMGLWQRLPLDAGARFAITTTTRYLIYIFGILFVANMLGFAWSKVGWLVAALTVGLGFGLQEIFANFVSGLIVLAERPVRVGDLVTIGNINGTVTKIQMRATTIRDWNHRELVVPNKKLVTDNLINWTLSDSNYRVDLVVGIAYGSDTEKAREILLEIAAVHPKILEKPRPKAIFRAFGDSSLEIEFRIYIPHMDFWPRVVTEVNTAIARAFKQAGIEIAFPQQDIHIRSVDAALPLADAKTVSGDGRARERVRKS